MRVWRPPLDFQSDLDAAARRLHDRIRRMFSPEKRPPGTQTRIKVRLTTFSARRSRASGLLWVMACFAAPLACRSAAPVEAPGNSEADGPSPSVTDGAPMGVADGAPPDVTFAPPPKLYDVCDGSTGLRFAHQVIGGGQVQLGNAPVVQNGHFFVFVTGACDFFVYGRYGGLGTPMVPVRSGRLTEDQVADLERISAVSTWCTHESIVGRFDGPDVVFWSRQAKVVLRSTPFAKDSSDAAGLIGLSKSIQNWAANLYREGQDLDGPIRLVAIQYPLGPAESSTKARIPWPLALSIDAVASDHNGPPLEVAVLVEKDTGLRVLREARAKATDPTFQETKGISNDLLVDKNPYTYRIHFRDVLPFEDETGFVRLD